MKKLLLILALVVAGFLKVSATNADLFTYDKSAVTAALSELTVLESYVVEHPALAIVTHSDNGTLMINGITLYTTSPYDGGPLIVPAFWWGCVFGPIGILIVYVVTNNDHEAVRRSVMGCVVWAVVWGVWWLAWYGPYYHYGY